MTSGFTHSLVDSLKATNSAQKSSIQSTLVELSPSEPYVRATAAHAVTVRSSRSLIFVARVWNYELRCTGQYCDDMLCIVSILSSSYSCKKV
eukprot:IDg606t1